MNAALADGITGRAPLLQTKGITKHFSAVGTSFGQPAAPVQAVQDVDLSLASGEVLGIVGESGSGKSTLGRLMLRLCEPTRGRVIFDGIDLAALGPRDLRGFRRHMQMIFQDPFASLNPRMSVREALMEPIALHRGFRGRKGLEVAERLMERVGLTAEQLGRYPRAFSGGQRQRIAIARALASQPRFLVADEPVSALDVSIQAEVVNLLQALQRDLGLTMVFISHDLSVIEVISDRVAVLYLGRIMEIAPTEPLYRTPSHPYTAALLQAIPGARSADDRLILKGEIPSAANPPSGCVFRTRCPFAIDRCAREVPALREFRPGQMKACIRDDLSF